MFEAKFQTFDDAATPGASAPRVAARRTGCAARPHRLRVRMPIAIKANICRRRKNGLPG
jgi:hypothetical protein